MNYRHITTLSLIYVLSNAAAYGMNNWFAEGNENEEARPIVWPEAMEVKTGGEILLRYENWDWFGKKNDSYDFQFQRTRAHLNINYETVAFYLEPQFVSMWNLPETAVASAPAGPSGMGALYYIHNGDSTVHSIGLHQAWLKADKLLGEHLSVKAGRMTYNGIDYLDSRDGTKFNTLKEMRLADRLLSSFEWSAFARGFDGIRAESTLGEVALTGSWFYPTEGGWEANFNETIEEVRIATLGATLPKGMLHEDIEVSFFYYNYEDSRDCSQRVDNSGTARTEEAAINMHVLGGYLVGVSKAGEGQWDYLLWGAYEDGDWYEQDHSAYAFTAETGYQWNHMTWKPWIRFGYFLGSGDSDPNDADHETFFQLAPGTRKYQLFPYYDLQNSESVYTQLILSPTEKLKIRLDYSNNRLAESTDLWYMGTGVTQEDGSIFGYLGRPSGGKTQLSQDASISISYQISPSLQIEAFYAHVWGNDIVESIYPESSDADYCYVQTTYKF
ncbi:MAG: alginate export family protein [Opitutales bacterium]|nr:alginate export family protein [Opitutales bacterium]